VAKCSMCGIDDHDIANLRAATQSGQDLLHRFKHKIDVCHQKIGNAQKLLGDIRLFLEQVRPRLPEDMQKQHEELVDRMDKFP
jgi:hypothetical protein